MCRASSTRARRPSRVLSAPWVSSSGRFLPLPPFPAQRAPLCAPRRRLALAQLRLVIWRPARALAQPAASRARSFAARMTRRRPVYLAFFRARSRAARLRDACPVQWRSVASASLATSCARRTRALRARLPFRLKNFFRTCAPHLRRSLASA